MITCSSRLSCNHYTDFAVLAPKSKKWENNIKINFKEMGWEDVGSIYLAQDWEQRVVP